jgi:hypothetical protein
LACFIRSNYLLMLVIPADILAQYNAILVKRAVPASRHADYKKWLRYYLDFSGKYPVPDSKSDRVCLFIPSTVTLFNKKRGRQIAVLLSDKPQMILFSCQALTAALSLSVK